MQRRQPLQVEPWLVLLITLIGAAVRFYNIGEKSVWLDEAFSIWVANQPPSQSLLPIIQLDQHPPTYYWLLHYWIAIFGDLQGPVRSLSALCSTLAIPVFYAASKRFFGTTSGVIAALLLALAPFQIRYAQEARMYALLTFEAAVALYFVARILNGDKREPGSNHLTDRLMDQFFWLFGRRNRPAPIPTTLYSIWIGLTLAQAAIMLTHNTATVFFPIALNLAVLGLYWWQKRTDAPAAWPAFTQPGFVQRWLATQAVALLIWSLWLMPFLTQARRVDNEFWISPPSLVNVLATLHIFNVDFLRGPPQLVGLADLLYWALAGLAIWQLFKRKPAHLSLLLVLFLVPLALSLLVSLRRPIYGERTLIWTMLPYLMLIAEGIHSAENELRSRYSRLPSTLYRLPLILLMVANLLALWNFYFDYTKEDWEKAAIYVADQSQPGDLLIFNASWVQIPFEYYFRHEEIEAELRGAPVDMFDAGFLEPKMTPADLPHLNQLIANRARVWLIYSHDWYTDPAKLIPAELNKQLRPTLQQDFVGLQVWLFEAVP